MLVHTLVPILLAPFWLVSAQSESGGNQSGSSANVHVSTSVIQSVGLGPDRQPSTFMSTMVVTITDPPQATPSGNGTQSGNSSVSANVTASSTKPLPTAPSDVPGGGGPGGAPVPGGHSPNSLGPDDDWISGALSIQIPNVGYAATILGLLIGGAVVL